MEKLFFLSAQKPVWNPCNLTSLYTVINDQLTRLAGCLPLLRNETYWSTWYKMKSAHGRFLCSKCLWSGNWPRYGVTCQKSMEPPGLIMHLFRFVSPKVSRRLGSMFYMMNLPLSTAALQAAPEKAGDHSSEISSPVNFNSEEMVGSPRDSDVLKSTEHLQETENNSPPSASNETAWAALIW